MSYFIIIRGPAGVGKSTIGNKLAESLHGECIHIDKVLEEHGLGYILGEKNVPEENFFKVNEILKHYINEQLNKGKIIILDENFYYKSQIKDLLEKIPHKHYAFTLKADLQNCIKRDKDRNGIGADRIKDVFKLVSAFDYGIIINTNNKTPDKIVREILSNLS